MDELRVRSEGEMLGLEAAAMARRVRYLRDLCGTWLVDRPACAQALDWTYARTGKDWAIKEWINIDTGLMVKAPPTMRLISRLRHAA